MAWKHMGDIKPRFDSSTLVVGDSAVMSGWPGAEAADYPDDEYALDAGEVMIFDLNLLQPTVFCGTDAVRFVSRFGGVGSRDVDEKAMDEAVNTEPSDPESKWGEFEVSSGAMVITNSDCATPLEGTPLSEISSEGFDEGETPFIPSELPTTPTLLGNTMLVVPCSNGRYVVSQASKVPVQDGDFDAMLQLTIRRA